MAAVSFHRLTADDLPRLHRWLHDPAVVAWWEGDDVSWPAVVRDYGEDEVAEHWVASLDGAPLGWIQCYPADHPEALEETALWAPHLPLETTAGIDYLIGEPSARGRGLGAAMIRAFVGGVVFAQHPAWTHAAAGPFEANVASCKALARAGLRRVARLDDEDGPCLLFAATRAELGGGELGSRDGRAGRRP